MLLGLFPRAVGLEPTMLILETSVLPIKLCPQLLQMEGIEPSSMDFQSTARPTKLHLLGFYYEGERWESNPQLYGHNIVFYPLNYFRQEEKPLCRIGIEPITSCLSDRRSTL